MYSLEMMGNTAVTTGSIVGRRLKQHLVLKDCMSAMMANILAQQDYSHHQESIVEKWENNLEMRVSIGVSLGSNEEMSASLESIEVSLVSTGEMMGSTGGRWENIAAR